ncbi:MAG TPA: hypothetical protein VGS22_12415 [Thermoanaerobaculia bacterium]|jgi:hypothetical protein|nr:hypothetical protein [Thermoanaerobaculia bacterium]
MLGTGISAPLFARILPMSAPAVPAGPDLAEISVVATLCTLFAVALIVRPREATVDLFAPVPSPPRASTWAVSLGVAVSALHLFGAALLVCGVLGVGAQGIRGAGWLIVPGLAGTLAFAMPFANALAWRRGWWSPEFRLWYALLSFAAVVFVGMLLPWSMLGWR